MQLKGAAVLITGGAGGIGAGLAGGFRKAGAEVITTDLPGCGADVDLDVCDAEQVDRVITMQERLDVVVANAGIGVGGRVEDVTPEDWRRAVAVNVQGVVNTVVPALERFRAQGHGQIVLMASLAGLGPLPLLAPYAMTKHAIVGLGSSLRLEAAEDGIGVTTVCPGPVDTALLDTKGATIGVDVRRYLSAAAGTPISPQRLADDVIEAVRKDQALVLPGRAKLLWRLTRLMPKTFALQSARGMRKELAAAADTWSPVDA